MRYRGPAEITVIRHGQSRLNVALEAARRGGTPLDAGSMPARNADVDLTGLDEPEEGEPVIG